MNKRKRIIFKIVIYLLLLAFVIFIAVTGRKKAVVGIESAVILQVPDGVTMEVVETSRKRRATITVRNSSNQRYSGNAGVYCIEKEIDGVWYILKDDNYSIADETWSLAPGGSFTQELDWYDHFGILSKGHYRIVKYLFERKNEPGLDICIAAEFDIK